jgi:hypothetical protein
LSALGGRYKFFGWVSLVAEKRVGIRLPVPPIGVGLWFAVMEIIKITTNKCVTKYFVAKRAKLSAVDRCFSSIVQPKNPERRFGI